MLNTSKVSLFVVLGIIFWFCGMLMIRFLGPYIFIPGSPLILIAYIACFPILYVALLIGSAISRIPMKDMFEPTVIMTFSAIFIDGAVIGTFPQAYGEDMLQVMYGAAWLLWGAAAGLLVAWVIARRQQTA